MNTRQKYELQDITIYDAGECKVEEQGWDKRNLGIEYFTVRETRNCILEKRKNIIDK